MQKHCGWSGLGRTAICSNADLNLTRDHLSQGCGPVPRHRSQKNFFIFSLDHAGNAEEIDQHPEAETADGEPVYELDSDAAQIEIMKAEEEPKDISQQAGFFAAVIVAPDERLRVRRKRLEEVLQRKWNGH